MLVCLPSCKLLKYQKAEQPVKEFYYTNSKGGWDVFHEGKTLVCHAPGDLISHNNFTDPHSKRKYSTQELSQAKDGRKHLPGSILILQCWKTDGLSLQLASEFSNSNAAGSPCSPATPISNLIHSRLIQNLHFLFITLSCGNTTHSISPFWTPTADLTQQTEIEFGALRRETECSRGHGPKC